MSSEQALIALEKSKEEPSSLLDNAAAIVSLRYDESQSKYVEHGGKDKSVRSSDFRQQWLLKWLIKKLNESTSETLQKEDNIKKSSGGDQEDVDTPQRDIPRLVTNTKTWALLHHLLQAVSRTASHNILIERRFTQLLTVSGRLLDQHSPKSPQQLAYDYQHERSVVDGDGYRPRNRRKLSEERNGDIADDHAELACLHAAYIDVALTYSHILTEPLETANTLTPGVSRQVMPAWSQNTEEASRLLRFILLSAVNLHLFSDNQLDLISSVVVSWLDTWHNFVTTARHIEKQAVQQQFCEECLNVSLELLRISQDNTGNKPLLDMKRSIERQIALHVILPLRTKFNTNFAKPWKSTSQPVDWNTIKPLYDHVVEQLRSSLRVEKVLGVDYISFKHSYFAFDLFDISARIMPRNDLRRRQWERPWLDALHLTLMHLAFPQHMYRLVVSKDKILVPENEDLPFDSQQATFWPLQLLAARVDQRQHSSLLAALYMCNAVLRWRSDQIPTDVLTLLIRIRDDIFVPLSNEPNTGACLELLLQRLDAMENLSEDDFRTLVQQIVCPLLRMFAQSRALHGFIDVWVPRLQNAFQTRSGKGGPCTLSALLWDDEEVFEEFEVAVKSSVASKFGQHLLESVAAELKNMTSRIGPTTDIFANLAILNSVIRARTTSVGSSFDDTIVSGLIQSISTALDQQSDYQGQRWRLWQMLNTLLDHFEKLRELDIVRGLLMKKAIYLDLNTNIHSTPQSLSVLLECLHSFSVVINYGPRESFSHAIKQLGLLLDELLDQEGDSAKWLHSSWSGHMTDLLTFKQLICGYFGLLIQMSPSRLGSMSAHLHHSMEKLLVHNGQNSREHPTAGTSLLTQAELLFDLTASIQGHNSFSQRMDMLFTNKQFELSDAIRLMITEGTEKDNIRRYTETITERLVTFSPMSSRLLSQHFALLAKIVTTAPVSIPLFESFSHLTDIARTLRLRMQEEHSLDSQEHLQCAMYCLVKIIHSVWDQIEKIPILEERNRRVEEAYKWCKRTVKQYKSSGAQPFELLVLDTVISRIKSSSDEFFEPSTVDELEARYLIAVMQFESDFTGVRQVLVNTNGSLARYIPEAKADGSIPEKEQVATLLGLTKDHEEDDFIESDQIHSEHSGTKPSLGAVRSLFRYNERTIRQTKDLSILELLQQALPMNITNITADMAIKLSIVLAKVKNSDLKSAPVVVSHLTQIACLRFESHECAAQSLLLALEISRTILSRHSVIIGQSAVDSLISSLSLLSSNAINLRSKDEHTVGHDNRPAANTIYDRLLTIMEVLLSRYRRRLNGRSHLVLGLLQNLLRCLFYTPDQTYIYQNPANTKQRQAFRDSLPTWLQGNGSQPLPAQSAERFSRILSSICNPSTASARSAHRSKKRTESGVSLNDETQKAKRLASQYMQYFVMEYAKCTLDGIIAPGVREKLMPGLYSVLDALGKDIMRAMNAAMDPSSRAIFKGLYDDWSRHGRWDQT